MSYSGSRTYDDKRGQDVEDGEIILDRCREELMVAEKYRRSV